MEGFRLSAEQLVARVTDSERLEVDIVYRDVFGHCTNAPEAVAHLKSALDVEEIEYSGPGLPLRGSEDFGLFNQRSRSAMFFLGAGVDHAGLHDSNYDFPDELIEIGSRVFMRTLPVGLKPVRCLKRRGSPLNVGNGSGDATATNSRAFTQRIPESADGERHSFDQSIMRPLMFGAPIAHIL